MAGFRLHDCRCLTHRESLINRHATPRGSRSGKLQLVVLALNHGSNFHEQWFTGNHCGDLRSMEILEPWNLLPGFPSLRQAILNSNLLIE
jgi:hypothetical protein